MNLKQIIKDDIYNILSDSLSREDILIENPKDRKMADYAVPCFSLSKILRKSPNDIGLMIKENLNNELYESVDVINGYLNIFVNKKKVIEYIINKLKEEKEEYGSNNMGNNKTIVMDYSSPNIAKPFGVGHLRSTVIGNAIKNISEKCGYEVVSINHLGDWGTQFGKLIYAYKEWGNEDVVRNNPIDELKKLYVKFHKEAELNPELEDEGRAYFKKLEDGDEESLKIWEWFKAESLKEFAGTYNLLGINKFDSYNGEAFYNDKMEPVIRELDEKNLLELSDGAYIVRLTDDMPPALIKRSDGATLYITRDLAAAFYRKKNYNFEEALYVVGNEQTLHFTQLKLVLDKMGYEWSKDIKHISFGMILQDGKKMSTRQGKNVKLHDVLVEAIELANEYIKERSPELENSNEVARQIGVGAVIFNDLKNYRTSDIEFNLKDILKFEGETGPYIQYTNARINSLLNHKQNVNIDYNKIIINEYTWNLVFKLYSFPEIIIRAKEKYDPSELSKYIIDLAQDFNKFYGNEKIIDDDINATEFRLVICEIVSIVLEEGMRILGIEAPKQM
ncbi:MAG: arginine--tRNA ligase [Bacilli bacterium]|nr:arginine--tRNA ligase [Bacilli bacterium]MDD4282419.1 arginine--tRNA ligase [Bacilli bacterium]MDD4718453.1 arginine--tRNA ligase [Bacilli bacterium]